MDIDGFWCEALRLWPSLDARLQSSREPARFTWRRDTDAPYTSFWYTDGPPAAAMAQVVADFGGHADWVNRGFSVGAMLFLYETGRGAGTGLRPRRTGSLPDPDLSSPTTEEQISLREEWAQQNLSRELRLSIKTDEALASALRVRRYPFQDSSRMPITIHDPLPMAIHGAQEFLDVQTAWPAYTPKEPDDNVSDLTHGMAHDGGHMLVNLTEWTLFLPSGEPIQRLSENDQSPISHEMVHCRGHQSFGAHHDGPLSSMPTTHVLGYEPQDLPSQRPGTVFIVHEDVLDAAADRSDLVAVGLRRRPEGWLPFDPQDDFDALDDDYWDRWVVTSFISRHCVQSTAAGSDAVPAGVVDKNGMETH